jgi:beta-N-acetylhexosaminidase
MRFIRLTLLILLIVSTHITTYARPVFEPKAQVDSLLHTMTLEQRVGQLFMVSMYGEGLPDLGKHFISLMNPGAVALFSYNGTNPRAVTQTVNAWQSQMAAINGIPLLVAVDQEGGTVRRLTTGFSDLPWGSALGAMPVEDARRVGRIMGEELSAVGISMNLAPVVDVRSEPDNQFIEPRTLGSNPTVIGQAASAFIDGMREANVSGVLKHFPGHGAAGDSHTFLPVVNHNQNEVDSIDLAPFRIAIQNGAEAVMVGHLVYPALDSTPGIPASLSPIIIDKILRKQLGFDGVIISDAMDMAAIVDNFTRPVAAVMAIQAGVDMIASGPHTSLSDQLAMKNAILDAVATGGITEARINESVRRILEMKARYNLLTWTPLDASTANQRIDLEAHKAEIEEIYRNTVTIADNANQLLPIEPGSRKVALIYPGSWSSIKRDCAAFDLPVRSLAYTLYPSLSELSAARTIGNDADLVVVFTYNIVQYPAQADLVNSIPPEKTIVVALQNPYDIEHGIDPAAYMMTFNAYPPAFKAACAILYGKQTVVGKWQP